METKNSSIEFTSKQCNQLKQLKETVKLHNLLSECEEFQRQIEILITERTECLMEQEKNKEYLTELQNEIKLARNDEFNWQMKLEEAKNCFVDDINDQNLKNICLVMGFGISKYELLENNSLLITLQYRDICSVTYCETIQGLYNVIEIYPQHPKFSEIRQYLQESQDLRGLLAVLRKYFDYAIEFIDKYKK
ncbi:hypothetical protein DOY81_005764 [Sarcophaga bullata]|nr:hypothetical protein DOY81_005764 [Sarcophaga bullata]